MMLEQIRVPVELRVQEFAPLKSMPTLRTTRLAQPPQAVIAERAAQIVAGGFGDRGRDGVGGIHRLRALRFGPGAG